LGLPPADMVNVVPAGLGECWVWGLSYSGDITAMAGDNASTTTLTDGCYELSSNFVVIFRDSVAGGMVSTQMGADTVDICLGGTPEAMRFDSTGTFGTNFQYVVTDNMGNILGLPPGDMVDFSGAGPGECWVWGLSYTGSLTAMMGDNATAIDLSDGCYELSSNYVVVYRDSIEGGTVTTMEGDTVYYCPGTMGGPTSVFNIDSMGAIGPNFQYVVTDNQGTILGLPPADMVDVGPAGLGECWVWGLSYDGSLLAQAGDDATSTVLADGCYELSSNYVVIFRDSVAGGMVSTQMGADTVNICLGGAPEAMRFDSTANFGTNFQYVVTDNMGNILGLPPGDMVDFSGAGTGECWVWGLSYTGNLTAMMGDNATMVDLADGCYELSSNYVVVYRDSIEGGMVQSEQGSDTLLVCYSGGTSLVYAFDSTGTVGANFSYVVTDTAGNILGIPPADMVDFGGAGPGECWVWGLSYNGELTAMMGDNALSTDLSSECFELSSNFIVVLRDSTGAPCATAIDDDLDLQSFRLYPVPAQDQLIIEFVQSSSQHLDARMVLLDVAGRQIRSTSLQAAAGQQVREEINLQGLAKGVYVLRITSPEGHLSKRFIKL
ncbi:MAG: T9SS type A sorting domain-containing protein, partial [Bacteroidota bacterium]